MMQKENISNIKELPKTWRARIRKSGKSQREFARIIGIGEAALSSALTGRQSPNWKTATKIEDGLESLGMGIFETVNIGHYHIVYSDCKQLNQ